MISLRFFFFLFLVISTVHGQEYSPTWESVSQHQTPDWFRDAKFGIYFHWGPYSVPAYKTEWYSRWMYVPGHEIYQYHREKYGPDFGYKDFISMFTAEKFDPVAWAALFEKSGAKFAGPVAEHADGFAMWDSQLTTWDAKDMGPQRDVVGEMAQAIRDRGMKFITTFHHQWLYAWYPAMDKSVDASDPEYRDLYGPPVPVTAFEMALENPRHLPGKPFNQRWLDRTKEVVDKYRPDLVYFDNKLNIIDEKYRLDFLQYYYNKAAKWNREVVVTYKGNDLKKGSGVLDLERARMSSGKDFPWLTDDSIDWGAWCDVQNPDYKTANRIIDFLVDVVSKNGCVLLNITPKANGEIPQPVIDRLLETGTWLEINGEAIYGTRPWKIYGEGPTKVVEGHLSERQNKDHTAEDIRFTAKGDTLYAIVLDWPGKSLDIRALGTGSGLLKKIKSIELLGTNQPITWRRNKSALIIQLPPEKPGNHAFVFKITP